MLPSINLEDNSVRAGRSLYRANVASLDGDDGFEVFPPFE